MSFRAVSPGRFTAPHFAAKCALGAGGVVPAAAKREADRASPAGLWPLRRVLYRADRLPAPHTALPLAAIQPDDGWCDAPDDPAYNRPVKLPYAGSAEKMWREDHLYDVVVILGHNDDPVVPGAGSAIFLHLARSDWRPTDGCIALAPEAMLLFLKAVKPGDALEIG